jgi:hypothetical protein
MDLPSHLRIWSVPKGLRVAIGALLAAILAWNVYLAAQGTRAGEPFVEPAVALLGLLLPLLLGALLFAFGQGGVPALQRRTDYVLGELLPFILRRVPEQGRRRDYDPPHRLPAMPGRPQPPSPPRDFARVAHTFCRGQCQADYTLHVPARDGSRASTIELHVDINVRRANVVLLVGKERLRGVLGQDPSPLAGKAKGRSAAELKALLAETMEGAAHDSGGAYRFSDVLPEGTRDRWELTGYRTLDEDFLWDPAKQLFFAQDLMIMVRSFWLECPALFADERPA